MSLAKYRKKRNFSETSEPAGKTRRKAGRSYVIQKHDASHLHYDFRLELGGVLLSWAVPKGPTLDPGVKRLAVQTEDHPVEYGSFEGTIPEGAYGGGTVMLWDQGTWEAEGDAEQGYKKGHLKFQLHGQKLTGGWHLVRTQRGGEKQKTWLLFKAQDDAARPGDTSLLEDEPKSVSTGRDLPEIAASKQSVWHSKRSAKVAKVAKKSGKKPSAVRGASVAGAVRAALPRKIEPELATLVAETPGADNFLHEVKFDGYRVLARVADGKVQLLTRNGEDWTERMPSLQQALQQLAVNSAILDGELVALDAKGLSDFQLLQNSFSGKAQPTLAYYAFDLLYLNGFDVRPASLLDRKATLKELLAGLPKAASGIVRYSDHVLGNGAKFFAHAAKLGLEGVVSKRAESSYRPGRGTDWQKSKAGARQEFVIVGFTEPGGSRSHLGALLLGVRKAKSLIYSGKVGTGFDERSLKDLHKRLSPLEIDTPKLEHAPRGADIRGVHWVKPKLVAEVAYTGITHDGLLRHPTFKGLREDKPAKDVVLEQPRAVASRRKAKAPPRSKAASTAPSGLSHPDKVLYPELGITKRELAEYYELIAERMLPHVVNRPLTLLRCPEGRAKQCFFQKHPGESLGEGLIRVQAPSSDGSSEYAAIADACGLQSLVQAGALELHIWGALAEDAAHPDRLVFDLDPAPDVAFKEVIAGARALRALLEEHKLQSWVKTTGGKGLHVTVPITPSGDWDTVKAFCRAIADELAAREPERYVATMSKAKRTGKIFIDYLRNSRGATFVAPYSSRAREGAGIAWPVEWEELTARFKPEAFNVRSAQQVLNKRSSDPFASMLKCRQRLPSGAAPKKRRK